VSVFGPTLGEYLEEWLARARVSVRESTWAAYRNAVGHLVDGLGGGSLRLRSALEVGRFEQQLLASGRSAKTVAELKQFLRSVEGHRLYAAFVVAAVAVAAALGAYGFVATFQSDPNFGRILAAYRGVFVAGSLLWGVIAVGFRPDRYDLIGAASG
jgi:drug/metabolite transporter superfamily protein YnfA